MNLCVKDHLAFNINKSPPGRTYSPHGSGNMSLWSRRCLTRKVNGAIQGGQTPPTFFWIGEPSS